MRTSATSSLFRAPDGRSYAFVFSLVTSLFLLWGIAHSLLDVLNRHFQTSLHVTRAESGLVQAAVYGGYFLMAIPAGWIARRYGYQRGIVLGLSLFALGAFWFYPATWIAAGASQPMAFAAFLAGLFVIALGLTCLETVANPYATVLGPAVSAASRINMAQTGNALGWILGPIIGGFFIFSSPAGSNDSNAGLAFPYALLGGVVTVLAVLFSRIRLPDVDPQAEFAEAGGEDTDERSLLKRPHFSLAVVAQFFYVAAQTGVNSFFINYMIETAGWKEQAAAYLLGFGGMGLFAVGRLSGSFLMRRVPPHLLLALYAAVNVILMGVVVGGRGMPSSVGLVGCYFFMSIMFPTLFSLGLHGLGSHTKRGASALVMAIVGGAVAPILMGWIADRTSMRLGFLIPMGCFAVIALYAFFWKKLYGRETTV